MKQKLKKISSIASLLPVVIVFLTMGESRANCTYTTTSDAQTAATAAVTDAENAATEAENAATEAEDAVPDDCVDCNTLKQRVLKLDNELDAAMQAVRTTP